jgi:nicotinate dehydrogenase subunit B
MNASALPANLKANPRLDRWVRFEANETVTVRSGKVELGQGIVTAMAQIAAEELDVALERLVLVPCDTSVSPEEAYTAGSQSIELGGAALRMACAEVRQLFIAAAARAFEVEPSELRIHDGVIELPGTDRRTSYWALAASVDLARDASGTATAKDARERHVVGQSVRRRDLPPKISGSAFIHDIELAGMVHGRVLRPPSYSARLESFDAAAVRALPGVCAVFVSGSFVGLCTEREEQAVKALEVARRAARWRPGTELPEPVEIRELLPRLPSERSVID